jgi:hypothetical protein
MYCMSSSFATVATMCATIALVIVAWWQIALLRDQFTTQFEDGLTRRYAETMSPIPMRILLGNSLGDLEPTEREPCRKAIYQYLDFCNEQAFLYREGRLRRRTWKIWKDGILDNMKLTAFQEVWDEVENAKNRAAGNFEFLRDLLD